jgi:hypothetical protein
MVMPDLMPSRRTSWLVRRRRRAFFVVPDWSDDISNWTTCFRKSSCWRTGLRREILGKACPRYREYSGKNCGKRPHNIASSLTAHGFFDQRHRSAKFDRIA